MESTDILLPPFHRGGTDRQGRECGGRMMIARYSPTTRCSLCIEGPCSMCHTMFAVELPLGYYELVKNMCDELACLAAPAADEPATEGYDSASVAAFDNGFLKSCGIDPGDDGDV